MNNICQVFESIQGEGFYTGYPMQFIRFNACNKICPFCDTDFSAKLHNPETVPQTDMKFICFTGGEPFLFKKDIMDIINNNCGKIFHGETNGAVYDAALSKKVIWAVSPKDVSDMETAIKILGNNPNSFLKLLYTDEVMLFLNEYREANLTNRVCIQPLTNDAEYMNLQETIKFCAKQNLPISSRLHLLWRLA